jgi:WD40 repeat protein
VTGGFDGTARVWDLASGGRELVTLAAQGMANVAGVAFSPDGAEVITGTDDLSGARIWDVGPNGDAEWANVASIPAPWADVAFMPVGHDVLATGPDDSVVNRWDPLVPKGAKLVASFGERCCVARIDVSSDGATVAIGYFGGRVNVLDAATGEQISTTEAGEEPAFALSPNGANLAVAMPGSNIVRIFDRSGRVVRSLVDEAGSDTSSPVFSPDGHLLATVARRGADIEANYRVRIWDWRRSGLFTTIQAGVDGEPVFDPAGLTLATPWGRRVEVWDVKTGDPIVKLPYQPGDIYGVAFSPDGSRIATGAADATVRLFDAASGQQRIILHGPSSARVAFSADGAMLATTGSDGIVRVFALDLDDLLEIARENVTRSLTNEECVQYLHIDRCPSP